MTFFVCKAHTAFTAETVNAATVWGEGTTSATSGTVF